MAAMATRVGLKQILTPISDFRLGKAKSGMTAIILDPNSLGVAACDGNGRAIVQVMDLSFHEPVRLGDRCQARSRV